MSTFVELDLDRLLDWTRGLFDWSPGLHYWPDTVPGHVQFAKGREFLSHGKLPDAVAAFKEAFEINPNMCWPPSTWPAPATTEQTIRRNSVGYRQLHQGHRPDRRLQRRPAIKENCVRFPWATNWLKHISIARRFAIILARADEAIEDFSEALRLDPKRADAYCGRGVAFLEKEFPELAIDDLNEAVHLAPESHEAVCQRARAQLALGEYDKAIEDARLAIRLNAKSGDAFRMSRVVPLVFAQSTMQ